MDFSHPGRSGRRNAVADLVPLLDGLGCLTGNPDHPLPVPRRRGGCGQRALEPMILAFKQLGYGGTAGGTDGAEEAHASGGGASSDYSYPSSHSTHHHQHPNRLSGDEYGATMIPEDALYCAAGGGGGDAGGGNGGGSPSPFRRGSRNSQRRSALAGEDLLKLKRWSDTSEDTK